MISEYSRLEKKSGNLNSPQRVLSTSLKEEILTDDEILITDDEILTDDETLISSLHIYDEELNDKLLSPESSNAKNIENSIKKNIKVSESIICIDCGKVFATSNNLKRHCKLSKICGPDLNTNTGTNDKTFPGCLNKQHVCPTCLSTFASKKGLKGHNLKNSCKFMKHERKTLLIPLEKTNQKTNKLLSSESSNEKNSENHIKETVKVTESIICKDCGKVFSTPTNLKRHCKLSKICGQDFDTNTNDKATTDDMNSSQTTTYECSHCGSVLGSLKSFNVHKNKLRCKRRCKICDYSSLHSYNVQTHIKKKHGLEVSINNIEQYNIQLINEHFRFNESDKEYSTKSKCPVHKCEFSSASKSGVFTHVKCHKSLVAKNNDVVNCECCGVIGIPQNEFVDHVCTDELYPPLFLHDTTENNHQSDIINPVDSSSANVPTNNLNIECGSTTASANCSSTSIPKSGTTKLKRKSFPSDAPPLLKIAKMSSSPIKSNTLSLKRKMSIKRVSYLSKDSKIVKPN